MKDGLTLNTRDERRVQVLNRMLAGLLTAGEAAPLLGVGERQARRLLAAYREEGPRSIVHGNRGRRPSHSTPEELRLKVLALATGRYASFNHSHLTEMLAEHEGISLSRATIVRILGEVGVRSPKPQTRRPKHRSRRERKPQVGMLLQVDASLHAWLQERGPRLTLLALIDDAGSRVEAARFRDSEDTHGYFLLLRDLCLKVGVPQALYTDKHGVFWPTRSESLEDQLAGRRSPTQFGRAMAELGIELIAAHSPQAKGRIERLWGTLQDRLVQELQLANVCTVDQANAFLPGFLRRFNRRFAIVPESPESAYRPRRSAAELDSILCFKHNRVVSKDNTVRLGQIVLQILPGPSRLGYTHATVTIHESLDARFSVFLEGRHLPSKLIPLSKLLSPEPRSRPAAPSIRTTKAEPPHQAPLPLTPDPLAPKPPPPGPAHPWRRSLSVSKSLDT